MCYRTISVIRPSVTQGNTRFGEWAESHAAEIFPDGIPISEGVKQDVLLFEGNAQGFRIASRIDNERVGHLRLTFATLGTMVKYPWTSTDPQATELKKYNCFSTEAALFDLIFDSMGLKRQADYVRHPLSFFSEAADDICYRVLDLEDAAALNIVTEDYVRDVFYGFLDESDSEMPLSQLRGSVIQRLIEESWDIFVRDYDGIMAGERQADLKSDFSPKLQDGLARVGDTYAMIFAETSKVVVELGAYKAIGRIIKALSLATQKLSDHQDFDRLLFISRRCLELAWPVEFIQANQTQSYQWWLHQILDYVSGLTDNHVRQLSREIEGI